MSRIYYLSSIFKPKIDVPMGSEFREGTLSKSQKLFLELGLVRSTSNGMNILLPIILRSIRKLETVIRNKMAHISGEEIYLPMLTPTALMKRTGRNKSLELFRLQDRHSQEFVLSPTHEECITSLISNELLSWKNFPKRLYQITNKYRDEMKPRFGLMRSREFIMKDLYCFDTSIENAERSYNNVRDEYQTLFEGLRVPFTCVEGAPGDIGGSVSHEYHLLSDIGEDKVLVCQNCNYSVNQALQTSDNCKKCGHQNMSSYNGIEVGHTFLLGTKYTEALQCNYKNKEGKPQLLHMSCHGIGVTRLLAAAVEVLSTDEDIRWPYGVAPFHICVIPPKKGSRQESGNITAVTTAMNLSIKYKDDVILDDRRDQTIGRRMLDAKRLGFPFIVVFGKNCVDDPPLVELHNLHEDTVDMVHPDHIHEVITSKHSNLL